LLPALGHFAPLFLSGPLVCIIGCFYNPGVSDETQQISGVRQQNRAKREPQV